MKKFFYLILIILMIIPTVAFAVDIRAGDEIFVTRIINDDVYLAGGMIRVDANVNGDLAVAGGNVSINSKISQDLTVVGGDIDINGEITDDLRVAGANIKINAIIKDDLLVGGGNVNLSADSFVGGDLIAGSANLVLNGDIQGNILAGADTIFINGKVNGNVRLMSVDKLRFGPDGRISGDLSYVSVSEFEFEKGQVLGKITYESASGPLFEGFRGEVGGILFKLVAGFKIYQLLSMLFFGLFLLWAYRFFAFHTVNLAFESPLKDLGIGVITLIVTPIVAVLFMITFIGVPLGLVIFAIWFIILYLATLMAALMIGSKIVRIDEKSSFLRMFGSLAIGALVYVLLGLIPIIGWLVKILITLIALGAMVMYKLELATTLRKKKLV